MNYIELTYSFFIYKDAYKNIRLNINFYIKLEFLKAIKIVN